MFMRPDILIIILAARVSRSLAHRTMVCTVRQSLKLVWVVSWGSVITHFQVGQPRNVSSSRLHTGGTVMPVFNVSIRLEASKILAHRQAD